MCKCLSIAGRIIIGILSVLFSIIGFVLVIVGILVLVNAQAFNTLFDPLLQLAKDQASTATGGSLDLPTDNFNIAELVGGLAIVFIVLGFVMLFIGVFGIGAACCMVKCMVIVYLVIVGILLISQIILVIIIGVNRNIVTDPAKPSIVSSLHENYSGVNGTDLVTLTWNVVMNGLQCCGVDNSNDFQSASKWTATWGMTFSTPAACCKSGLYTSGDDSCATSPTDANNNQNTGCWDTMWNFIFTGTAYIIFACVDIGGFFLLTFFTITILYDIIQKAKVGNIA